MCFTNPDVFLNPKFQKHSGFGKKIVFAMGLIFIPFVFYPILAFGKSQIGEQPLASEPKPEKKTKKKK